MTRLAIVTTHPIQYYAPWFRFLAEHTELDLRVFYLWDFGVTHQADPGFGRTLRWDVPLLHGYPWELVPNRSRRPGTGHFRGIDNPQLAERLRDFDPDAALLMGYTYASFARLLWSWDRRKCPLLFRGDSHRLVRPSGMKDWLRRRLIAGIFRRFAAFLYVGAANRDYLLYHGVPEERLFFSPHAIDNQRFLASGDTAREEAAAWRRNLGIPEGDRVILFAGKFEPKKRSLDLLEAFHRAAVPQTALLLVGSGELEAALRARAGRGVYFAPFQNQTRMPCVYAAADVVVLPSYGPRETWGLCINEAMCLAKPIIVSSHVGCARDLVVPGKSGLIFPAGDVEALAGCLRSALGNLEQLTHWGQASLERVQHYSYHESTTGVLQALEWLARQSQHSHRPKTPTRV
jgi:glycosyltransferase involved in cell wall biosynthesis